MISLYAHAAHAIIGARDEQEDAWSVARAVSGTVPTVPSGVTMAVSGSGRAQGRKPAPAADELIAVLADGMGGHVAGAMASQLACRCFVETYTSIDGPHRLRLTNAMEAANTRLSAEVRKSPDLEGMGCTLVAATFGETGLRWISVGDSPMYLFRSGRLYQLNEDHSMAPVLDKLAKEGQMTSADALRHPHRHFLRAALTGRDVELVDLHDDELPLESGDWVILASDGIETLSHAEIANVIARHDNGRAEALVQALTAAVTAAGSPYQDNTTVIAVRPEFGA